MRARLFLAFLTITLISSQSAPAEGTEIEVTYPFMDAGRDVLILNPYLEESFLGFLRENSVYAVMERDGLPLLYYSEDEALGCRGICSNITMNNYTLGSKILDASGIRATEFFNESMVAGSSGIENLTDTINSIRASLAGNPEALAGFERQLLEEQEGYLRSTYFGNAYDDVWGYALEEIKKRPEVYSSLTGHINMGDIEGSIADLEGFLNEGFDISGAYDMFSLFSAIENKRIGQVQLDEFMRNVLKRLSEEENMELNLDDIDLDMFSDLLKSEEFKNAMEKALETIMENPELFDRLGDLADEMLSMPETKEIFKEAVKEMLRHADWESVMKLMELFNKIDNKQQLLEALMEGTSEHMREMVQSGMADEIMQQLEDPELMETFMETVQDFSKGTLESLTEWAEETPMALAYVIAIAAVIATLIILMKIKI
jgi:hypothetical protein